MKFKSYIDRLSRWKIPKSAAAGGLTVIVFLLILATRLPGPINNSMWLTNKLFYDIYYRLRPIEDHRNSDVVIVTADEGSIRQMSDDRHIPWPWPRYYWGAIASYACRCGAKAVAFDMTFEQLSSNSTPANDAELADTIGRLRALSPTPPIIFGDLRGSTAADQSANTVATDPDSIIESSIFAQGSGRFDSVVPPLDHPILGAVNIGDPTECVSYRPMVYQSDSLAAATVKAIGRTVPASMQAPFPLHFYGPTHTSKGKTTFTYLLAANVIRAAIHVPAKVKPIKQSQFPFKDKIVLIGTTAHGTFDLHASPLDGIYPGVEVQATAVENMLEGQRVLEFPPGMLKFLPLLFAVAGACGSIYPRRAWVKLLVPAVSLLLLLGIGVLLFRRLHIWWLPPGRSLLALMIATPSGFAYTYFIEDRQSQFMLSALKKVVSPAVADALSKDPGKLKLDTEPRVMTMLFTDLVNFTGRSESMKHQNQELVALLNAYFEVMSAQVIRQDGTLDKYIGDSLMCFWNAPQEQTDHAVLACRAALAMHALQSFEFKIESADGQVRGYNLDTRIGINTDVANFGFVGSSHRISYTILSDGVNLASRLEGANKLYGTRILISESTAALVKDRFHLRKLDLLQVKGKGTAIEVYELIGERNGSKLRLDPSTEEIVNAYHEALANVQHRNWDLAEKILLESKDSFGHDPPSLALLARIGKYRENPPPEDWDGSYEAKDK
jgi:adenylate cyclase